MRPFHRGDRASQQRPRAFAGSCLADQRGGQLRRQPGRIRELVEAGFKLDGLAIPGVRGVEGGLVAVRRVLPAFA